MAFKLLIENPDVQDFQYIIEEKNEKGDSKLFVEGPYMQHTEKNRNGRIYNEKEMRKEVHRYVKEMIEAKRSIGELNHPTSAEVNPEKACHMVLSLKEDGNTFVGKSQVLSTPAGQIMRSLIMDGVRLGMSTRALGQLEEKADANYVSDMRLVAVDCVADPSFPKAFVNGILESKSYVLAKDGSFSEAYGDLELGISNLPKKDLDNYLKEQICAFLTKINTKL